MNIESAKFVYFSPTGTTRAVLESIAEGLDPGTRECIDITLPAARAQPLQTRENELLVIGVPVYMGRVPALVTPWLHAIRADHTPTVCVVVYGNRTYEDALRELADIVTGCGCIPVAGGAYVGEHSFSDPATPTAQGRPDARDLRHAREFGKKIRDKLLSVSGVPPVHIPGMVPYRGDPTLWKVDFIEVGDACTECGTCTGHCPAGAIDAGNPRLVDISKCITCCACIKRCPEHARSINPGLVKEAQLRLHTLYPERKEPEYFMD